MTALGAGAMVFGEFDDSPGLQGIGLLVIIAAVTLHARWVLSRRRSRQGQAPHGV